MKNHIHSLIIATAILLGVGILAYTYKTRNRANDLISVTGLGSKDFEADLIVWTGDYNVTRLDLKEASAELKNNQRAVEDFLKGKGIREKEIVFSAVETNKSYTTAYDASGRSTETFAGYRLSQSVSIESREIDKVERVSREVTDLITQGIEINSFAPGYYYTRLSELKIEMVATATEDATTRAQKVAEKAGAQLGHLRFAQMGVFQITAQNSNDDYSWGGSFDTGSRMKTANITMKLQFGVD